MPVSIYEHVRRKLVSHGVNSSKVGRLTLTDRRLFLDFVRLERAIRSADFDAAQGAVAAIERRANAMGKRQLLLFAYMYARFSPGTPKSTADFKLDGDGVRIVLEYRQAVSPSERLISDWATIWYDRNSLGFSRALSQTDRDLN